MMYGPYHSVWCDLETHLGIVIRAEERGEMDRLCRPLLWLYSQGVWRAAYAIGVELLSLRCAA